MKKSAIAILLAAATGVMLTGTVAYAEMNASNTLIYAGENEDCINPLMTNHDEITDIIFSGLMKYDANGKPVNDLAESYEYDETAMKYTFHLRDGVKWHDGEVFSAEDVVFTYEEILNDETLGTSLRTDYEDIAGITAVDDHTVEFTMSEYDANMLGYFTMGIVPKHLLENTEDMNTDPFNQAPVGTGRYKFVEWDTAGGMITLQANADYYDKIPNIEYIVYKTVAVESTKATMIQSGEADLAWLNSNYAAQFKEDENYNSWVFKTADYRAASMDMASDFWSRNGDSIGVLNYALNKDVICQSTLQGQGCAAYSPIQMNPLGSTQEADIYPYDPGKFAEEMEKLGWEKNSDGIYERNGEVFHFTIQTRDYEEERIAIANMMSQMLKDVGVEMEVVLVTKFDWSAGYNGFLAGYATQFDPDMIYKQYVTDASDNRMKYSNAKVDELLAAGRHEADPEKRKEIYAEFEKVYAEEPGVLLAVYLDGDYVGTNALEGLDTTRVLGHHAVGVMWNVEDWTLNR
ncbi:MAG: ABC transporter substrate-binding protein [Lachnospiraceae bacterium]|nr:ABC transporter substrate-binding protein [Lachnospiraceae bacterium]